MNEIYWLTRVGELDMVFGTMWILPIVAFVIMLIAFPIFADNWCDEIKASLKKWAWRLFIIFCIGIIGDTFIPSKKDVLLIYGLGTTVDYIKSSDKAKQLPDKAVDALTRYLDEISKEEEKK